MQRVINLLKAGSLILAYFSLYYKNKFEICGFFSELSAQVCLVSLSEIHTISTCYDSPLHKRKVLFSRLVSQSFILSKEKKYKIRVCVCTHIYTVPI